MRIEIHRNKGSMGAWVPLDIFVDGAKVAKVRTGETAVLTVSHASHQLQVVLDTVCSPIVTVQNGDESSRFECGTEPWVSWDFLNLCYLPSFRNSVFFLKKSERRED